MCVETDTPGNYNNQLLKEDFIFLYTLRTLLLPLQKHYGRYPHLKLINHHSLGNAHATYRPGRSCLVNPVI